MDDQQLIAAIRDRDPAAVQEMVGGYGDRLLRSAVLLCGNETDAQDLVQETFLQAFQSVHRFAGRSTVYTWLHAILLNLARHYHRSRKRLVCDDQLARRDTACAAEGLHPVDARAASSALLEALESLSEPHREVLVLRFYENMKIHEIARHLGVSNGTIKSRLHYAIAQMEKLMPREMNLFCSEGTK